MAAAPDQGPPAPTSAKRGAGAAVGSPRHTRLVSGSRGLVSRTEELVKFYAGVLVTPYPTLTITIADGCCPGATARRKLALVQQPLASTPYQWREDPLSLDRFPDFLLGHEVRTNGGARGQFKNYHDQWLSEGSRNTAR